jgi:hypothetical protein
MLKSFRVRISGSDLLCGENNEIKFRSRFMTGGSFRSQSSKSCIRNAVLRYSDLAPALLRSRETIVAANFKLVSISNIFFLFSKLNNHNQSHLSRNSSRRGFDQESVYNPEGTIKPELFPHFVVHRLASWEVSVGWQRFQCCWESFTRDEETGSVGVGLRESFQA